MRILQESATQHYPKVESGSKQFHNMLCYSQLSVKPGKHIFHKFRRINNSKCGWRQQLLNMALSTQDINEGAGEVEC